MSHDVRKAPASFQVFGPAGQNHSPGLVPDPGTSVSPLKALMSDGTWQPIPTGTVTPVFGPAGPSHSTGLVPDPGPTASPLNVLGSDAAWHLFVNSVFGPAGPSHAIGLVPDPGPSATPLSVLASNATWIPSPTVFGPAGPSHSTGLVPDPGASAAPVTVLTSDGTWQPFLNNVVVSKTSAYSVAATDNGNTHDVNGNFTVVLGAASGFGNFALKWYNSGTRGVLLNINGFTPFYLYPGQTVTVQNRTSAGAWAVEPLIQQWFKANAVFHVDPVSGLDSNDGLDSAPTGAWQTIQHAWNTVQGLVNSVQSGTQPTIALAPGSTNHVTNVAFNGQPGGTFLVNIDGQGTAVIQAGALAGVGQVGLVIKDYASPTFLNCVFAGDGPGSICILAEQHVILDFYNCIWGTNPSGFGVFLGQSTSASYASANTFAGSCDTFVVVGDNSSFSFGALLSHSIPVGLGFTQFVLATGSGAAVNFGKSVAFTGSGAGSGSGGKQYTVDYNAVMFLTSATLPGNTAGTTAHGAWAV